MEARDWPFLIESLFAGWELGVLSCLLKDSTIPSLTRLVWQSWPCTGLVHEYYADNVKHSRGIHHLETVMGTYQLCLEGSLWSQ